MAHPSQRSTQRSKHLHRTAVQALTVMYCRPAHWRMRPFPHLSQSSTPRWRHLPRSMATAGEASTHLSQSTKIEAFAKESQFSSGCGLLQASPLEDVASSTSISELNTKVEAFAKKHGDSGGGVHTRKRTRNCPTPGDAGSSAQASPTTSGLGMDLSGLERRSTAPALMLSSLAEAVQAAEAVQSASWQQASCGWLATADQPTFQQVARNVRVQRHGKA